MNTNDRLHGIQGVFARFIGIIDKCFRYFNVFRESGNKINVSFTVSVYSRLKNQVLINSLFEIIAQRRQFAQDSVQILSEQ